MQTDMFLKNCVHWSRNLLSVIALKLLTNAVPISERINTTYSAFAVTRSASATSILFTVTNGANLILDNITIGGGKNNGVDGKGSLVCVAGSLKMNTGAILQNNTALSGGGVFISNYGRFTMGGGKITCNSAEIYGGGGVYIGGGGIFTLSGGEINSNTSKTYGGGGVYINRNGVFVMNGGKISGNSAAYNSGGGVYVNGYSAFDMRGGEVSGNIAAYSGGIYVAAFAVDSFGGNSIVKDNTKLDMKTQSNVCLGKRTYMKLTDRASQMEIWVQTEMPSGIIVESGALETDTKHFQSDTDGKIIIYKSENNGQLIIE